MPHDFRGGFQTRHYFVVIARRKAPWQSTGLHLWDTLPTRAAVRFGAWRFRTVPLARLAGEGAPQGREREPFRAERSDAHFSHPFPQQKRPRKNMRRFAPEGGHPCIFPLQAETDRFHPFDRPGWIVRCALGTEMIP
jgi:hypothetical protein